MLWLLALCLASLPAQQRGIVLAKKGSGGALQAQVAGGQHLFGTYHALLISIEKYQRPFAELKTPHEDISRLKRVLRDQYGLSQFTVLQDEQATRAGILKAVGAYRGILKDQDNLLIYFAGHGLAQDHGGAPENRDYYWVPYDGDRDFSSWVPAVVLRSLIRNIRARHTVLISDSCFSGGLLRSSGLRTRSAPKSVMSQHKKASCQVFTSGGLEPVEDQGREGCSLFAYHLARRLETQAEPFLTLRGLAHMVTADVSGAVDSRQVPELGPIRGARHEYGDFVFLRTAAAGSVGARPVAAAQEGVPTGWLLPPGMTRSEDGRFLFQRPGGDQSEMILVPGGRYRLPGQQDWIEVDPFLIDKHEVSNARFKAFLKARPQHLAQARALNREGFGDSRQPVVSVSLQAARAFAAWAGKTLPSTQQWDCAAGLDPKQRSPWPYPWGRDFAAGQLKAAMGPPRLGINPKDRSPDGVLGLGGGVRELCELSPRDPGRGVIRGGTEFLLTRLDRLEDGNGARSGCNLADRFANVGFRCVLRLRRP